MESSIFVTLLKIVNGYMEELLAQLHTIHA